MNGQFNKKRLMGNCERCYYATDQRLKYTWLELGEFFFCHRYPKVLETHRGWYCGEFASIDF